MIMSEITDATPANTLDYSAEAGTISATVNDNSHSVFSSGSVFPAEGITIQCLLPQDNYEFLYWIIESGSGKDTTHSENPLVLDEIDSDTSVVPKLRYFSQSNSLSNIYHLDTKYEYNAAFEQWGYFSPETRGGSGMSEWTVTSTPLIVDDYIYTYCGNQIYKIQGTTGIVVAQDTIEPLNGVYYRYLGYGGGYIIEFNSGKIFDLDLNQVTSVDKSIRCSFYNNGFFYGMFPSDTAGHSVLKKFFIAEGGNGVSVRYVDGFNPDVTGWHGIYGTQSAPVFVDGYLYYISATTTNVVNSSGQNTTVPYKIFLNSIDLETGAKETIDLGLDYKYIDDGWVTYDGQYLYVTSYVGGLDMGGGEEGTDNSSVYGEKMSSVTRIAIDSNGHMEKQFDVNFDEKGVTSQFVVYNGRGYVNVNQNQGFLYVYDMSTFSADSKPIYKNQSVYTHGSIVLNAYNDGTTEKVQIFLIGYELRSNGICVIEDYAGKTTASNPFYYKDGYDIANYCSQGVRFLPNGNLVFYQDPGCLVCVGPETTNDYYFFISDGTEARWVKSNGKMPSDALSVSGYALISDDGYTLLQATTDTGKSMSGDWNIFALNQQGTQWIKVSNNYLNNNPSAANYYRFCHYYQIVKSDAVISYGTEWNIGGSETYTLQVPLLDQGIVGKQLVFSASEVRYSIHTEYESTQGSLVVSDNNPIAGSSVTVTVTPIDGYSIESVCYSVGVGQSVILQPSSNGQYRFTMPSSDITVGVQFLPIYSVTYHVGDGAGKDVSINESIYTNAVRDYTVYAGYGFEFNIFNPMSSNQFEGVPDWLVPAYSTNNVAIIERYSGTVEGLDCNITAKTRTAGNQWTYEINLNVGYFQESFVKGNVSVADIPGGVTNNGKTFVGWSTDPSSDKVTYRPGSTFELNSNLNLYAVWSDDEAADPASIHYNLSETAHQSDGRVDIDVYINRDVGNSDLKDARLLVIADYDGGIFVNVYSVPSLDDGVGKERITVSSQGLISVTVQVVSGVPNGAFCWYGECTYFSGEQAKGVVVFVTEHGNAPSTVTGISGTRITLGSINADGLRFNGWTDGTTTYPVGSEYIIGGSETTLTALWVAIPTHSVTYDVNGGSISAPVQSDVAEGSSFTVASYEGTKANHTFVGWNDGVNDYAIGSTYVMGNSNVTLIAIWVETEYTYTVHFSSSRGNQPADVTGTAGTAVQFPTIDNTLYEITGWKIGDTPVAGGTYTISADDADANNTITLTAVWERIDPGMPEYAMPHGDVIVMPRGQDFVFRLDYMTAEAPYLYFLNNGSEVDLENGTTLVASTYDDTTLADMISTRTVGVDGGITVVEFTISKDLESYSSGWDHLVVYHLTNPMVLLRYEEP